MPRGAWSGLSPLPKSVIKAPTLRQIGRFRLERLLSLAATVLVLGSGAALHPTPASASGANCSDPHTLRSMAFEHYLDGETETSLRYYQEGVNQAIKSYGADSTYVADLYYEMGTLAFSASRFETAQTYLQKAVKQNPNSVMARVKLAELFEVRERPDKAFTQIQAALAKDSKSPQARHAYVMWLIDRKNCAADAIREAYALNRSTLWASPKSTESETALASMTAAVPPPVHLEAASAPVPSVLNMLHHPKKTPAPPKAAEPVKPVAPQPKPKVVKERKTESLRIKPPAPKHAQHHKEKEKKEKTHPAHAPAAQHAAPVEQPQEELRATAGTLKTSVKLQDHKVGAKPVQTKPQPTENETKPAPQESTPEPVQQPAPRINLEPPRRGKPRAGLVPPPPPMVPFGYGMPPPRPRPKPVVKEKPKEQPKEQPAAEKPRLQPALQMIRTSSSTGRRAKRKWAASSALALPSPIINSPADRSCSRLQAH